MNKKHLKVSSIYDRGDLYIAHVANHPNKNKNGWVYFHRWVMECYLGRFLNNNEVIHHIDGNKKNNHINNLKIMSRSEHAKHHANMQGSVYIEFICPYCGEKFKRRRNKISKFLNFCSGSCSSRFNHLDDLIKKEKRTNNYFVREFISYPI